MAAVDGFAPISAMGSEHGEGTQSASEDVGRRSDGFCGRAFDAVTEIFCRQGGHGISSLGGLIEALGLQQAVLLAHSTSLDGRLATPINPRAIWGGPPGFRMGHAFVAFTRGVQRVELSAFDEQEERINFYLLEFEQACNGSPSGCLPGDLYTPAIEEDWASVRVRDDEELKNTVFDCRRCHGGAPSDGGKPMLLMRELVAPWAHWFGTPPENTLTALFAAAKQGEPYATVERHVSPWFLEGHIRRAEKELGQPQQPLLFASRLISRETMEAPEVGVEPGPGAENHDLARSPTWFLYFDAYKRGYGPAPPYHHKVHVDPAKLAEATAAYRSFLDGTIERQALPDIGDILPDDARLLSETSFAVAPEATEDALLVQACGDCHNAALDPTISRARFDIDLHRMNREELDLAVRRLQLPEEDPQAMPPKGARTLTGEQRGALVEYRANAEPAKIPPRFVPPRTRDGGYRLEIAHHIDDTNPRGTLHIADLTGDSLPDLVTGKRVLAQRPDGSFASPVSLPAVGASAFGDVNGDERVDIIGPGVAESDGRAQDAGLLTYLSKGALDFGNGIASAGPDLRNRRMADVDGDGHLDMVGFKLAAWVPVAYYGDGRGRFSPVEIVLEGAEDAHPLSLDTGDVTGDGADDLLILDRRGPPMVGVFVHAAPDRFTRWGEWHTLPAAQLDSDAHVRLADANSDGALDLVVVPGGHFEPSVRVLLQQPDKGFGPAAALDDSADLLQVADMNGDGRDDLVMLSSSPSVRVRLQGPLGLYYGNSLPFETQTSGSVRNSLAVGDLNADGCPDLVAGDVVVGDVSTIAVFHGVGCSR